MFDRINQIMESEHTQRLALDNSDVIQAVEEDISIVPDILKGFIMSHPHEFLAEDLEQTYKNIKVFGEIATQQIFHELVSIHGTQLQDKQELIESKINEYF